MNLERVLAKNIRKDNWMFLIEKLIISCVSNVTFSHFQIYLNDGICNFPLVCCPRNF